MKAKVADHFIFSEDTSGTDKAQCKHCPMKISTSGQITSNLILHLKRKHPAAHAELS